MDADDLVAISWTDVRRIAPFDNEMQLQISEPPSPPTLDDVEQTIEELDEDVVLVEDQDFEQFLGIQRELSSGRVSELRQYVHNVDATFPTAVLLAISSAHARFDESTSTLSIVRHGKVAKVIDGQHRIAGTETISWRKISG